RWILTIEDGARDRGRLTVDPEHKRVTAFELLEANGDVRMSVSFDGFESAGPDAGEMPRTSAMKMPKRDLDIDIKLKEVDVNQSLDASLLRIVPPPGVVPERLDSPAAVLPGK